MNRNLCSQSGVQVGAGEGGGFLPCPRCGAWLTVPRPSPSTTWPELRSRWPEHTEPDPEEDDRAAQRQLGQLLRQPITADTLRAAASACEELAGEEGEL